MRKLQTAAFVVSGLCVLLSLTMQAQVRKTMDDPLFGISYEISAVHFESLPESVVNGCPELRNRYRGAWVYARAKSETAEYFIVSGLMKDFNEETGRDSGTASPDITGIIVAIHDSTCSVEAQDSFYWNTGSSVWKLTDAQLNTLAADAIRRYSKAFGGKDKFLKRLSANNQSIENVAPALRKQVELLRTRP